MSCARSLSPAVGPLSTVPVHKIELFHKPWTAPMCNYGSSTYKCLQGMRPNGPDTGWQFYAWGLARGRPALPCNAPINLGQGRPALTWAFPGLPKSLQLPGQLGPAHWALVDRIPMMQDILSRCRQDTIVEHQLRALRIPVRTRGDLPWCVHTRAHAATARPHQLRSKAQSLKMVSRSYHRPHLQIDLDLRHPPPSCTTASRFCRCPYILGQGLQNNAWQHLSHFPTAP